MPQKMFPLLSSWAAGEVTPRIHVRPDLDVYSNGARLLRNFFSTSHGPVERREGVAYVDTLPSSYGRIFGFEVNRQTNFVIAAMGDGNLYVNDSSGRAIDPSGFIVSNASFNQEGDDWITSSPGNASVTFYPGACELSAGNQSAAIQQQVTTTTPTGSHITRILIEGPNPGTTFNVGTTQGGTDIFSFTVADIERIDLEFTPGAGNTTFWIEVRCDSGVVLLDAVQILDPGAITTEIVFPHPWDDDDIRNLQVAMPSGEYAMYFVTPDQPPQKLTYNADTEIWSFAAVTFTSPPSPWTGNNWPAAITFFQNRMWLAATPNEPETFWASKSNDYENFDPGTAQDDDGLEFQLNFRGRIDWMAGVKNLLIGTENSEYIVTSKDGVVTSGDIQVERQSSFTSANVQPIQIGNDVIYVSADGRKVRNIGYKWTDEQWVSLDITFMSEHLTQLLEERIVEMTWSQNPNNLLWCVQFGGTMIAATYEKGYDVIGWHRHETDGEILSVCNVEAFGASDVYLLVRRNINDNETYLEKADTNHYLDSHVEITNYLGPQNIVEVPHLANKTVGVIADGAVHPDITLDASGIGTLNDDYTTAVVGLKYTSTLETLPLDNAVQGGVMRPQMRRWSKIYVSLVDSYRPTINGSQPPTRFPQTPMDTQEPPRTEYVPVANFGRDRDAIVTVEQDLPLSCTINGIFGEAGRDAT